MNSNPDERWSRRESTAGNLALVLCLGIFLVLLVRTAWQADDSYTAWRLVNNFVDGYGLRNNIDERVQTFTSMLWTMLNAAVYFFSRNIYFTSISLSIVLSIATLTLLGLRYRKDYWQLLFLFAAITLSISFMDFSAAGFENPLSHLMLACFTTLYFSSGETDKRKYFLLFFIAGMAGLTRVDALAYYIPALALTFYRTELPLRQKIIYAALGLSPLILWHCFTVIYFGFPLQNAAYAKRFNGLPLHHYLRAGMDFYLNSISRDPITLTLAASAMVVGFLQKGNEKLRVFTLGIPFYLAYVMYVGGDYMSGRFFSIALLASVIVILRSGVLEDPVPARLALSLVVILGCLGFKPTFTTGKDYGADAPFSSTSEFELRGISDERSSWYQHSGLLLSTRLGDMPRAKGTWWDFQNLAQEFVGSMGTGPCVGTMGGPAGYASYFTPRTCHVYDLNGQVDPLMARLPIRFEREWRQGHHFRPPVKGYHETLLTGKNQIEDPDLAQYYEKLRLITRGNIWSWERFKAIFHMNLGHYQHLLDAYASRMNAGAPKTAEDIRPTYQTSAKLASPRFARSVSLTPGTTFQQRFKVSRPGMKGLSFQVVTFAKAPSPYKVEWKLASVGAGGRELARGMIDAAKATDWAKVDVTPSSPTLAEETEFELSFVVPLGGAVAAPLALPLYHPNDPSSGALVVPTNPTGPALGLTVRF